MFVYHGRRRRSKIGWMAVNHDARASLRYTTAYENRADMGYVRVTKSFHHIRSVARDFQLFSPFCCLLCFVALLRVTPATHRNQGTEAIRVFSSPCVTMFSSLNPKQPGTLIEMPVTCYYSVCLFNIVAINHQPELSWMANGSILAFECQLHHVSNVLVSRHTCPFFKT